MVTFEGETYQIRARQLVNGAPAIALTLAASGPKMLEMAGAEADAVLISAGTSVEFVRWSLDHVARARAAEPVRRVGLVYAAVDDDPIRAHDRLRRILAITLRGPHHAHNLNLAGNRLDSGTPASGRGGRRLDRRRSAHQPTGSSKRMPPAARRRRSRSDSAPIRQAGLDEVVISGVADPIHLERIIAAAGMPAKGES